jgi:serine/threonine protein kinase/Tol biopolymer transport system component
MPLKVGEMLRHRYRIEETLGQGGMGAVYRATDINLGVGVAVKENLFTTEEYARQFRREATILASLRHTSLPRVTDHFVIEGEGQYLVMDFIEGEDLRERLERDGPVREDVAVRWFVEVCDALAYLHSRTPPIVHRDIKPGNIKITPEDHAVLVDFGLAKVLEDSGSTTTGAKAMTPGFSPPEQYGAGRTDPRTDIYALAATLYTALTASIPEDSLERAMGRATLTPIRRRNPKVSSALSRAIERALSLEPEDRYQTMSEFAAALAASGSASSSANTTEYPYLERTIVSAAKTVVRESPAPALRPPPRRSRWPVYGLVIVTVLTILAGAIYALPGLGRNRGSAQATIEGGAIDGQQSPSPGSTGEATQAGSPTSTPVSVVEPTEIAAPSPTPPGGGIGQLAFASDRDGLPQVYVMNIDGTGVRKVTDLSDGACQPAWSPDAQQLAFTSPCRANRSLYPGSSVWIVNADGTGLRALVSAPGGDFDPAWSPLGDKIAFTSLADGHAQIYVVNVDGTGRTNLSDNRASDNDPSWSPSGSQIIFTSLRDNVSEVWIMPASGGAAARFSRSAGRDDSQPSWSPDGKYVAFDQVVGGVSRLVAMQYKEGDSPESRICPDGPLSVQPMAEPAWSPDGQWLVFETWPTGVDHEIALVTSSCANYAELTSHTGLNFDAAWRP